MKKIFLCIFLSFSAIANDQINSYDARVYSPVKKGLKDLYFELRNSKVKGMVEKTTGLKIKGEIYFQVYWRQPSKVKIDVVGIPSGYSSLELKLKSVASEILDYVIPRSLNAVMKNFTFKNQEKEEGLFVLRGTSKNKNISISEVFLHFDKNDLLRKMITISPYSRNETNIKLSTSKGSDNKYLMNSLITNVVRGSNKLKIEKKFTYQDIKGYLLPKRISVSMKPIIKGKSKANESELVLSSFKVNEGVAAKRLAVKEKNK